MLLIEKAFGGGWVFTQAVGGSYRALYELATTVRTPIFKVLSCAVLTKCALVTTDAGEVTVRGQIQVTTLAIWF